MPYYFAFGANMASEVFVGRRKMRPTSAEAARLDDYVLRFSEPGLIPKLEPAYANVEPSGGDTVHGVLYALSDADLEQLHQLESANYETMTLAVRGAASGGVEATMYRSRRVVHDQLPSRRYRDLLVRGAVEHDLPQPYRDWLAAHPAAYVPVASEALGALAKPYMMIRRAGFRPEVAVEWLRAWRTKS